MLLIYTLLPAQAVGELHKTEVTGQALIKHCNLVNNNNYVAWISSGVFLHLVTLLNIEK